VEMPLGCIDIKPRGPPNKIRRADIVLAIATNLKFFPVIYAGIGEKLEDIVPSTASPSSTPSSTDSFAMQRTNPSE
jgi:hypothetical protein